MNFVTKSKETIKPKDIAKYFLYRARLDGELVSPLKMQKLIYYAYAWTLVKNKKKLFKENIEAWPNGPVVRTLYVDLKKYGSSPIGSEFIEDEEEIIKFKKSITKEVANTLDEVYEKYIVRSPFELVMMTHNERPWVNARKDLKPNEPSSNVISDKDIVSEFSSGR